MTDTANQLREQGQGWSGDWLKVVFGRYPALSIRLLVDLLICRLADLLDAFHGFSIIENRVQ